MKSIPKITAKQKEILLLLYTFRYLNTHQFQKLFNHKNPNRLLSWLKDLKEKELIHREFSRSSFANSTKPAIYCLSTKAKYILKNYDKCDPVVLERLYKEKDKSGKFMAHCLALADIYLFFLSQRTKEEELHFFTKHMLTRYEHFPETLPDAYIALKQKDKTIRYFLHFFDDYTPPFVPRARVREYFEYIGQGIWEEATGGTIPPVLFVFPNETRKRHIYFYAKSLLEKTFDEVSLYLTTKDILQYGNNNDIWEKVKVE